MSLERENMHLKKGQYMINETFGLIETFINAHLNTQFVYMHILLVDRSFCEAKTSHLSCVILLKCVQNVPRDLFGGYGQVRSFSIFVVFTLQFQYPPFFTLCLDYFFHALSLGDEFSSFFMLLYLLYDFPYSQTL